MTLGVTDISLQPILLVRTQHGDVHNLHGVAPDVWYSIGCLKVSHVTKVIAQVIKQDGELHELVLIVTRHQVTVLDSSQVIEGMISQVDLAEEVRNEILNDFPCLLHCVDLPHIGLHNSSPGVEG